MLDPIRLPTRAIRDQGDDVNCCTSCALAACLEATRQDYPELSPVFHYYVSRRDWRVDRGLTMGAVFSGRIRNGICTQDLHDPPYSKEGIRVAPSGHARDDGRARRAKRDRLERFPHYPLRSSRLEWELREALDRGHAVLLGFRLDARYADLGSGADRWEARGPATGAVGHAAAVIGYEDAAGAFVIQDSRGPAFGRGGQWYLPYSATRSSLLLEAYEIAG